MFNSSDFKTVQGESVSAETAAVIANDKLRYTVGDLESAFKLLDDEDSKTAPTVAKLLIRRVLQTMKGEG